MINFFNKFNIKIFNIIILTFGFFFSQFYIFPSGLPQPAHIFIIFSFLIFIFFYNKIKISDTKPLIYFVCYVIFINIFYTFIIDDLSYLVSTIYWIFNLILFLVLVNINVIATQKLFFYLRFIILISLIINILIWGAGFGRYNFSPRYNGYFNDPNQMAFWVLCSCAIGLVLYKKVKYKIFIYCLSLFLILLTMSRSATLGFIILTLGLVVQHKSRLDFKILLSFIAILITIILFSILLKFGFLDSIILRFYEGIQENDNQTSSRGFDILINFPEYLFLGAGQGAYYLHSYSGNEIHSTWFGILFYYGIIGFILFLSFIYNIFKKLEFAEKIIFLGPMFYGFFTYSVRTLVFWFLVAIFLLYSKNREHL